MTLKKKLEFLPDSPGCYIYRDNIGEIIYVGKAKNLKNRVKSYFTGTHNKKTQVLVSKIEDLEYIIVNSEKEALILENNLIKKYRPYFNIRLKDDKSYPYLMITKEEHQENTCFAWFSLKTELKWEGDSHLTLFPSLISYMVM